jgi:hypothetical protein
MACRVLHFLAKASWEIDIETACAQPGDVIHHNGIAYEAIEDNDDDNGCDGCAADDNDALCRALPDCAAGAQTVLFVLKA